MPPCVPPCAKERREAAEEWSRITIASSSAAVKTSPDTKQTTQGAVKDERLFYKRLLTLVQFTDKKDPSAHQNPPKAHYLSVCVWGGGFCSGSPVIYFNHIYS